MCFPHWDIVAVPVIIDAMAVVIVVVVVVVFVVVVVLVGLMPAFCVGIGVVVLAPPPAPALLFLLSLMRAIVMLLTVHSQVEAIEGDEDDDMYMSESVLVDGGLVAETVPQARC